MDELVREILENSLRRCSDMNQNEFDAETKVPTMPSDTDDRAMLMQRLTKPLQDKMHRHLSTTSDDDDEHEVGTADSCTCFWFRLWRLPCKHMIAYRELHNMELTFQIPRRWSEPFWLQLPDDHAKVSSATDAAQASSPGIASFFPGMNSRPFLSTANIISKLDR